MQLDITERDDRPLPMEDELTAFFWEGARDGRLLVQRCGSCGEYQYPPDIVCVHCQSPELTPEQVSGRGRLYSFATVDRPFHSGFVDHVPYILGLIELEEQAGLKMLTNVVEADAGHLSVGMPVEVVFETRGDIVLPQFRPAGGSR